MDREAIQERFGIIGKSDALRHVIDQVRLVGKTEVAVLVQGESGVGKELVAHAIRDLSNRRHGPMIIVNCGAIPEGLLESELFGTEKGAYTGAGERRADRRVLIQRLDGSCLPALYSDRALSARGSRPDEIGRRGRRLGGFHFATDR